MGDEHPVGFQVGAALQFVFDILSEGLVKGSSVFLSDVHRSVGGVDLDAGLEPVSYTHLGFTEQDSKVAGLAHEAGKALSLIHI